MHTREAFLPDAERIHDLISSYSGDGTLLPRTLAELCENVRDFIVLEEAGYIIGCGAMHLYGPHLAEIRSITVDKNYQKRGGGELLVQSLMSRSPQARGQLHLPVHPHSGVFLQARIQRRAARGPS